jgi:hypothetical protein
MLRNMLAEMGGTIGGYFRGQAILSAVIGTISVIAYWAIGMPYAVGLGLVMGFFEAIPIIGPTLGAIPAILVALTAAPDRLVWLIGVVVVIQVLENNLLVPRVMDESVGVNAIVTILAIAAFGALFGVVGAILAIPLAGMTQIVVNRILFSISPVDEPATVVTSGSLERTQVSKLRLQAQEIVQDVRKGARTRTDESGEDLDVDQTEDLLESIALDLDGLLSELEQPAQAEQTA